MTTLCIYTDTEWGLGEWARGLAAQVPFSVALRDWAHATANDVAGFDLYLTLPSTAIGLERLGVSHKRIAVVAHDESDLQRRSRDVGEYRGYAVVSDSLACSSLALGIARIPTVLRLGVDFERFRAEPPKRLEKLGYTTVMSRRTESGVERKRGHLARIIAQRAGLEFVQSDARVSSADLPARYRGFDALVMTSLQEGAGQPPLEAAAAGRLVIGTPVGQFPRLAYEGVGIMGPLGEREFVEFAVDELVQLSREINRPTFLDTCNRSRAAAKKRDWSVVGPEWSTWLEGCYSGEMNATELILAPNTSPRMTKIAQSLPPYDLLKAYREASVKLGSNDIVLVVSEEMEEGFVAMTRPAYVDQAFRRWTDKQRKLHPLASTTAHARMRMPPSSPAFWLVVESPKDGLVGSTAIGVMARLVDADASN